MHVFSYEFVTALFSTLMQAISTDMIDYSTVLQRLLIVFLSQSTYTYAILYSIDRISMYYVVYNWSCLMLTDIFAECPYCSCGQC